MNLRKFINKKYIKIFLITFLILNFFATLVFAYCAVRGINPIKKIPFSIKENIKFKIEWLQDLPYLVYKFKSANLPVYDLYIDTDKLDELNENLPSENGLLRDENKKRKSAKFVFNNEKYDVDVKYRGSGTPHWAYQKKSWRIETKNDTDLINGMSEINFIVPHDREFHAAALSSYRAKKLGLLTPFIEFAILRVNGKSQGIYLVYEQWGKEFLEKNDLSGDANLYGELFFTTPDKAPAFERTGFFKKYAEDVINKVDNFAEIDLLSSLIMSSSDEEFYENIFNLVDEENFYLWQVHNVICGSTHQIDRSNMRLYFNNAIGKFQFIPWDTSVGFGFLEDNSVNIVNGVGYHILLERILKNPEFLHKRNKLIWEYVQNNNNLEDDLRYLNDTYKKIRVGVYNDNFLREQHVTSRSFDRHNEMHKKAVESNFNSIREYLKDSGSTTADIRINFSDTTPVVFDLITDSFSSLELEEIKINKIEPQLNSDFLIYYDSDKDGILEKADLYVGRVDTRFDNILLHTEMKVIETNETSYEKKLKPLKTKHRFFIVPEKNTLGDITDIELDFKIVNSITKDEITPEKAVYIDENTFEYFDRISESANEFLTRYPIFEKINDKKLVLLSGSYIIRENVIIPKNLELEIKAGTTMYFDEGVSLISYSPISAVGAEYSPIKILALNANKPRGTFAVVDAKEKTSEFSNTIFEHGGSAYVNGIFFSGALALHRSNVKIDNSEFKYATGDDGLNVKYANAIITNSKFIQNGFDALDFDFVSGEISNSEFLDNGNDGVDISGSNDIVIKNNIIKNSGDKGISVGEKSNSLILNNQISGCDMGIAVKDLSRSEIKNNEIFENRVGISAYQKKLIFGGGFPKVWDTIFRDNQKDTEADALSTIEFIEN